MILLQTKSAQKAPMPLELGVQKSKDPKQNFSFLQLLKGFDLSQKQEEQTPKEAAKTVPSSETLKSLLQNSEMLQDAQLLHPKLVGMMDKSELTTLIHKAKEYLKSQIEQSPEYKKAAIKELPQTLRSLVEVAQKFGLDISKISVQTQEGKTQIKIASNKEIPKAEIKQDLKAEIRAENKEIPKAEIKQEIRTENKEISKTEIRAENKEIPKTEIKQEIKAESRAENKEIPKTENKQEIKAEIRAENKEIPKAEIKQELKAEIRAENKEIPKAEIKQDLKAEIRAENKEIPKAEIKQELKAEIKAENKEIQKTENKQEIKQEIRAENKEIPKQEIKAENKQLTVPLFKAQMPNVATTEQFVQIKQIQANLDEREAKSKTKTKDTLSSLLRQDKEMQDNPKFTADFSVATAKVIAPKAQDLSTQQNPSRNLESLLRDSSESGTKTTETTSKVETQSPLKAESFEVKLNEAKQMIKYLSSDVKNAIEEYKSPFTRVKLQLNPQRLGEIDLTIVQRGKNLHVNMSSNNTAINTLSVHMNELRTQLSNNGINNATFNFNSNSESSNGSADQGQQRQDQHKAHHEYGYFAEEETSEELARSLEIVVPQYI